MAAAEAYRKAFLLLIVAASILLALFLLSIFEDIGRSYLAEGASFTIDAQGNLVAAQGADAPSMMTTTSISLVENLLRLVKVLLWLVFVVVVVRMVTKLLFETVLRAAAQSEIASLAKTVLSIVIYIVAFFIIFQSQYPQIELAPLFTGSAILGIVVGLALQDTLGNLFAGIAMQADQPFQVGDVITIADAVGVVESVSWRGVRIRTFQSKLLVISNAVLGKETIEVAPQDNLNARIVYFNTVYADSPAKTAQVVRDAIRGIDNISSKIRPIVRIRNLGDNGLDWEIKYWAENYAKYNDTDASIRQRIWYAFQREGISFAYPTRTVHMETVPEPVPVEEQVLSKAEYLERVPIFAPLSDEEIAKLAKASVKRIFAPGETIVRKGQEGGSMYILVRGSVKVQLAERSTVRTVGQLGPADFFGEMSLLTGEPRTANVVTDEETEVLQIRKTAIKSLFEANPALLESISKIVAERREVLSEKELEQTMHPTKEHTGMISAIRKFFGLKENG